MKLSEKEIFEKVTKAMWAIGTKAVLDHPDSPKYLKHNPRDKFQLGMHRVAESAIMEEAIAIVLGDEKDKRKDYTTIWLNAMCDGYSSAASYGLLKLAKECAGSAFDRMTAGKQA